MARVQLRDSWYAEGAPEDVRRELLRFFHEQKMKVVTEEEDEVSTLHAEQGSQLWTRLLGGWFVSATKLPKRATVTYTATTKGIVLRATIEETLGFGYLDPLLADKYTKFFENWMIDLEEALHLDPRAEKPSKSRRD